MPCMRAARPSDAPLSNVADTDHPSVGRIPGRIALTWPSRIPSRASHARAFLPEGSLRQHLLAPYAVRVHLDVPGNERPVAPVDRAHIRPRRDAPPAAHALHAAHRVRAERGLRLSRRKLPPVVDEVARKERDDYKRRGECEERSGDTDEFRERVSARCPRTVRTRAVWQAWHGSLVPDG
jgi:hypothetical protein